MQPSLGDGHVDRHEPQATNSAWRSTLGEASSTDEAQHGSMDMAERPAVHGTHAGVGPAPLTLPNDFQFQFPPSNPLVGLSPPRMPSPTLARKLELLEATCGSPPSHAHPASRMSQSSSCGPEQAEGQQLNGQAHAEDEGCTAEEQHDGKDGAGAACGVLEAAFDRASYEEDAEVLGTSLGALLLPPELPSQLATAKQQAAITVLSQLDTSSALCTSQSDSASSLHFTQTALACGAVSATIEPQPTCQPPVHTPCSTLQHMPVGASSSSLPFISYPPPSSALPFAPPPPFITQPETHTSTAPASQPANGTWAAGQRSSPRSSTDHQQFCSSSSPHTPPRPQSPSALQAAGAHALLTQHGWRDRWEDTWGAGASSETEAGVGAGAPCGTLTAVPEWPQQPVQQLQGSTLGPLHHQGPWSQAQGQQPHGSHAYNQHQATGPHYQPPLPAYNQHPQSSQPPNHSSWSGDGFNHTPARSMPALVQGGPGMDLAAALDMGRPKRMGSHGTHGRQEPRAMWWSETMTLLYLSLPCIIIAGAPMLLLPDFAFGLGYCQACDLLPWLTVCMYCCCTAAPVMQKVL